MCGIAGLWAPGMAPHERLSLVDGMLARMRHRGPDGAAAWDGDGTAIGITRLAIVAPTVPARVYSSESGRIHAVVNGEIYNYQALLASLRARGHDVERGPDTTVVPHLYEEDGADFPVRLDGMFAVALWDAERRRLVLVRDRAGEKPLFYTVAPGRFAFASEPGALAALPWVSREPAAGALARYLAHGFFAGRDSAFRAIHQLPPAHVMEVVEGAEHRRSYWRPWDALSSRSIAPVRAGDLVAQTRTELEEAVRSRIPGDVPFGVFLSGGVDSGLVATFAARLGRRFPVFSLKLADRGYDETAFAREVARGIGAEYHEETMDADAGAEALETYAQAMDQPLGDPSLLPTWALARLAARHVPVVLTGEGGDELFAGYPTYLGHRHAALAAHLPGPVADAFLALARRLRPRHHHVTIAHVIERFLDARRLDPLERHLAWFGTAAAAEARALLAPELRARLADHEELAHLHDFAERLASVPAGGTAQRPKLVAWQVLDFELYLGGGLLSKVDRCTMAHSVESRAPFLRQRLVEFALALPDSAKLRGGAGKWALKQAAKGLLPDSILARRKQGFSPPFSAWARGPLRALVSERLSPGRIRRAGVLDPATTERVLDDHVSGRAERGRTLWALLSLQMWAERWVAAAHVEPVAPARESKRAAQPAFQR
ncbi:MAG: asparagine synthase (glutamine-hydrolyzing) [Candidatus Eisenbacteria bacterium]|nr:asparagine synthase (glutamine-hydrolyzing) [Candidatus Eisenbacteria bacterium]